MKSDFPGKLAENLHDGFTLKHVDKPDFVMLVVKEGVKLSFDVVIANDFGVSPGGKVVGFDDRAFVAERIVKISGNEVVNLHGHGDIKEREIDLVFCDTNPNEGFFDGGNQLPKALEVPGLDFAFLDVELCVIRRCGIS